MRICLWITHTLLDVGTRKQSFSTSLCTQVCTKATKEEAVCQVQWQRERLLRMPPVTEAPKKTGSGGDQDTIPGTVLSLLGSVGAPQL